MTEVKDILILGIGNLLLKDEGIGVHVVERLKEMSLPEHVEVLDGGTAGLDLVEFIEGRKKLIVIDAVNAGEKPGTLYRLTEENLDIKPKAISSFHEIDFIDALHMSEISNSKPEEIVVIGIEPKDMSEGIELSPEVQERIPEIIKLVLKELNHNGVNPKSEVLNSQQAQMLKNEKHEKYQSCHSGLTGIFPHEEGFPTRGKDKNLC